eukprot:TRINITY_DN9148_c0_g1_i1.p1 TRINITY_DN9148_c0_g1~~TRINITY_DN9148_c0_g1_i1.p1  ORF type:complete len:712 (+),score=159.26 TRINITY_DN9148_c0_g1_i1:244-2136(+)
MEAGGNEEDDEDLLGGWAAPADRDHFLRNVRRHDRPNVDQEGQKEIDDERKKALLDLRALAFQPDNCLDLFEDELVKAALLDATQAPNPNRGKSIYVDDGPPDNNQSVRAVATGVLLQMTRDPTACPVMAQDKQLREFLVECLQQVEPPKAVDSDEEEETQPAEGGPAPVIPTPFFVQSRAQPLLGLLALGGACAKALARPKLEEEDAPEVQDEDAEEEHPEEDPEVQDEEEPREETEEECLKREALEREKEMYEVVTEGSSASKSATASGPGTRVATKEEGSIPEEAEEAKSEGDDSSSESSEPLDADALLAEVEDILYAEKPSSDEDLLEALFASAHPINPETQLEQVPPWRPGATRTHRIGVLWTLAATRNNAELNGLWRFDQVREVLLRSTQTDLPDNVRACALGALAALCARDENKPLMFEESRVVFAFQIGVSAQVKESVVQSRTESKTSDASRPASRATDRKSSKKSDDSSRADIRRGAEVATLRPQAVEVRRQAIFGIGNLAEYSDAIREALWFNRRISSSLIDAAEKPSPLRALSLRALRLFSQSALCQQDMVEREVHTLMEAAMEPPPLPDSPLARGLLASGPPPGPADEALAKRDCRFCELGKERLLEGEAHGFTNFWY